MTLKELREKMALTQTELAAKVGVTAQSVYAWERGEYEPTFAKIRALSTELGVSIQDIQEAIKSTVAERKRREEEKKNQ